MPITQTWYPSHNTTRAPEVPDPPKEAGPYGFSREDWIAKSETERQNIRNWVYSQLKSRVVDENTLYGYSRLIIESPTGFDSQFGGTYVYNQGFRKLFSSTASVGFSDTTSDQLKQREDYINGQEEYAYARNMEFVRLGKERSYSGCDIVPSITIGSKTFVIGNISTISYSIHRDKTPVRVLGHTYPKGFVSAGRTIAGTLVFTVFDRHVLRDVLTAVVSEKDPARPASSPLVDQLPPFDITITYQNEYGSASYMRIYGIEISDEGQTHSINDIYTENIMQYVARDIDLMVQLGDEWTPQQLAYTNTYNSFFQDTANVSSELRVAKDELSKIEKALAESIRALTNLNNAYDNTTDVTKKAELLKLLTATESNIELFKEQIVTKRYNLAILQGNSSDRIDANQSQIDKSFTSPNDSPYALDRKKMSI